MYFPEVIQSLVKYLRYSFFEIVNDFQPSTIFAKSSILYVCQGLEYASTVTNIKPKVPTPQNGQRHSSNLSAICDELFERV